MAKAGREQKPNFGKLVLFVSIAAVVILVGYFTSKSNDNRYSPETNQEDTKTNVGEDRVGEDGLIYTANGNVYSADKHWVWSEEKDDWIQNPDLNPTERALKAASNEFLYAFENDQNKFIKNWSNDGTETSAIRNLALYLDETPEKLALVEAAIEKYIAEQARPVLNYSPNQVSYDRPSLRCRSYGLGNSVYTDCN